MKIWKIAGITLAVVMTVSLVTGSLAFAQNDDPEPNDQNERRRPGLWLNGDRGFDRMPDGRRGTIGPWGGDRSMGGFKDVRVLDILANALGLSSEELQAELDAGKRIPEIVDEFGIERADLMDAFSAARVESIEQAVADGTITQEQADQMLDRMTKASETAEAQDALRAYQIKKALAEGAITQEQADLLSGRADNGFPGFGTMRHGRTGRGGFGRLGMGLDLPFGNR